MLLKSGCRFKVSSSINAEISATKHILCTSEYLRTLGSGVRIVSVGDVTTERIVDSGLVPYLQIVDLKTKRSESNAFSHVEGSIVIKNEAGTISHDLFFLIRDIFTQNKPARIEVTGEEDLAVLPIIYYSDDNTVVAYGVPDVGMACLRVDSHLKLIVNNMLERMEIECQN
ncbi:MAG: GTP-dependent dephospho-CoA kinase family protein [Thermoplasmata archaeon]